MVRLFQVQLEHYEKIEGEPLSLEGKANQLAGLVRANLPAAMQGFVVVPLFAGFDERRRVGRVFSLRRHRRQVRGGRLPGQRLGRHPRPQLDQGPVERGHEPRRRGRPRAPLAVRRGRRGRRHRWPRPRAPHLPDRRHHRRRRLPRPHRRRGRRRAPRRCSADARRGPACEHALLRLARAGDEGPGRLRPQGHRPRPQPGRHQHRRRHRDRRREPVPHALQDQRDLRPHRVRRRRQVQRVRDAAHRRRPPRRPQGLLVRARRRERPLARQRVRADARAGLHPRDEAVRGRDPRRAGGRRPGPATSCSTSSTTAP